MNYNRNLIIDVGKTFYEGSLQWFTRYKLREIHGVILTHGHADAMYGLDDLRQWTLGGSKYTIQDKIDVYLTDETMKTVQTTFPYLVDKKFATGGGDIVDLIFKNIPELGSFQIDNLKIQTFPVIHGKYSDGKLYYSLGFRIEDLVYISDANEIPKESRKFMKNAKIMIIDGLKEHPHNSHFSFEQAVNEINLIKPEKAFIIGLCHHAEHEDLNYILKTKLKVEGIDIKVSYDGLILNL